ncbi:uncharacterized protein LOC141685193 [Apium graveolens]|uniref:uncharacterized protein LOC141685193 n=1 Tax=Apium graveolens TaxID=4045 RepID=UPI003D7BB990
MGDAIGLSGSSCNLALADSLCHFVFATLFLLVYFVSSVFASLCCLFLLELVGTCSDNIGVMINCEMGVVLVNGTNLFNRGVDFVMLREDGCEWSLKARLRKALGKFQIMKTSGPHTCMSTAITQDHRNLSSYDIVEIIKEQIVANPRIKEKVLMTTTKSMFGYLPGRKKIRNAKKLVMDEVHGSWEGSYKDLPYLMEALQSFNVGIKVDWLFKESKSGVHENLEEVTFKRLFWALKPCIDRFEHCIPVIHIDDTHLYGPYPGVLLSDVAVDGFSHILPLAFAIVESENVSSWGWFMDRLRRFMVGRRHGICIISDRHVGIMAAMRQTSWCEPYNHHRFWIKHLSTNFVNAYRRPGLKDRLVDLASQVQEKKFDYL